MPEISCCCLLSFVETCPPQPVPVNGAVSYTKNQLDEGYPLYTVADYSCNEGYTPSRRTSSFCRKEGWSHPPPTCAGNKKNVTFCYICGYWIGKISECVLIWLPVLIPFTKISN